MILRIACIWLLSLAAASCAKARPTAEPPKRCSPTLACASDQLCGASFVCVPRGGAAAAAMSSDAGLSEIRVPDAGSTTDAGSTISAYRVTGSLSAHPDRAARDYVLQEQRLELLEARCGSVAGQTLCVSGSLSGPQ